jgi:hypothetical protein
VETNANDLNEVTQMVVSYKKLWQLLIDRDMMKKICKNSRALAQPLLQSITKNYFSANDSGKSPRGSRIWNNNELF